MLEGLIAFIFVFLLGHSLGRKRILINLLPLPGKKKLKSTYVTAEERELLLK